MKKIEELEKIKLIETLNMNEETTLRFFSRWDKFKDSQHQLIKNSNELLDKLEEAVSHNKSGNDPEISKMINDYFGIEGQLVQRRENFVHSLSDILDQNQIAKLLVFEKRFREEIKNALFKQRMREHKGKNK
ncbi:MAG: hypothetical protein ACYCVH_02385 [Ignavibacteriaceae bacterium]